MKIKIPLLSFLLLALMTTAQESSESKLPYYEIPDYPEEFNAATVAARLIDGLGFRYYWATEGLRAEDLSYRPNDEARSSEETLEHIYGLTNMIVNSTLKKANGGGSKDEMSFEVLRAKTLENIKTAADILRNADELDSYPIIFGTGEKAQKIPFWNQLNGPIADALWHCGQVVLLRRSSGNPFNSKASVFSGKVRQ